MLRKTYCLPVGLSLAGAAVLLTPALASAHTAPRHAAVHRHYHHVGAYADRYRERAHVRAVLDDVATSPFYGLYGGYNDAFAASNFSGPTARHYFGYAAERRWNTERRWNDTSERRSQLEGMIAQQAGANGVPESLVHRVITRESGYNPRAVASGNYGLMQIRLGTARAMGYSGSAAGLLDAQTNMTYAVRYLAGAYRAAGGNEARAVALYARGYNAPRDQDASSRSYAYAENEGAASVHHGRYHRHHTT
jgi:soluble lytic murein transglycosylase-like protein